MITRAIMNADKYSLVADEFVDLYDLAARLVESVGDARLDSAARDVQGVLEDAIVDIAIGAAHERSMGLTVYLPWDDDISGYYGRNSDLSRFEPRMLEEFYDTSYEDTSFQERTGWSAFLGRTTASGLGLKAHLADLGRGAASRS